MNSEESETIALRALGWLVSHEELCPVFLGATGSSTEDLALRASDPHFLASVLEFLTMDDRWVMEFCDASDLGYEDPLRARYGLPGAEQVNWT